MNLFNEIQHLSNIMLNDIQVFVVLMAIDVITGLIKGTRNHRLSSSIMNLGIRKKSGMIFAIVFAIVLDAMMFKDVPTFTTMMVLLSIANEGLSICENLSQLGVPIPKAITNRLKVLKEDAEESSNKE